MMTYKQWLHEQTKRPIKKFTPEDQKLLDELKEIRQCFKNTRRCNRYKKASYCLDRYSL